jgi:hypothetical protein
VLEQEKLVRSKKVETRGREKRLEKRLGLAQQ